MNWKTSASEFSDLTDYKMPAILQLNKIPMMRSFSATTHSREENLEWSRKPWVAFLTCIVKLRYISEIRLFQVQPRKLSVQHLIYPVKNPSKNTFTQYSIYITVSLPNTYFIYISFRILIITLQILLSVDLLCAVRLAFADPSLGRALWWWEDGRREDMGSGRGPKDKGSAQSWSTWIERSVACQSCLWSRTSCLCGLLGARAVLIKKLAVER